MGKSDCFLVSFFVFSYTLSKDMDLWLLFYCFFNNGGRFILISFINFVAT